MNEFRFTLGVADLARAVAFYRVFLHTEPADVTADFARFELTDPPLSLTLSTRVRPQPNSSPGFRLSDRVSVLTWRDRLLAAGLRAETQTDGRCGYAEQLRVHVPDPDGNWWSLVFVERQLDPWTVHRSLEGPAASVPTEGVRGDGPAELLAAGLVGVEWRDGWVGYEPTAGESVGRTVLYKGPFLRTTDDLGNVYVRGRRVAVDAAAWDLLRRGGAAEQFLFLGAGVHEEAACELE